MKIKEIKDNKLKKEIANYILRDLPEWFGIEESTKMYINTVVDYPFIAAYMNFEVVGFYSLRPENNEVLDLYVLGVLKRFHRQGVGSNLEKYAERYAIEHNYKYLMVITLADKANNYEYRLTRIFYLKNGFIDFYQNDNIFDKNNPAQILIKSL